MKTFTTAILRTFFSFVTLCVPILSYAQLEIKSEVGRPSASVNDFTKYGKFDPQLYSGKVSVSVPIYSLSDEDFTIPISLDYSYNGFVPNSQASEVGLGWTLSAGVFVYKSDGTIVIFDGCSYPSDTEKYPTLPEKEYNAIVGKHKGKTALNMFDIYDRDKDKDEDYYKNERRIELGFINPAYKYKDERKYAQFINIHWAGDDDKTGICYNGKPWSEGCPLVKRSSWDAFISIFDNDSQRNNLISVTISRTLASPTNKNIRHERINRINNTIKDKAKLLGN